MLAAAVSWGEFLQQLIVTVLPVLVGWLGHLLGFKAANGAPPTDQQKNPGT
jgi:hypothetical protein